MAQSRVTIKDVANDAGVSTTTVSHVLNGVAGRTFREDTRIKVHEAAERLGYFPNSLARGLRTQRSGTVAFIGDEVSTTPFAGRTILGAQDIARARDSVLLITSTGNEPDVEAREIQELLRRQIDGVLYAAMYHRHLVVPKALLSVPVVAVNCTTDQPEVSCVAPDEVGGGWDAADVLISAGHRRLAFVNAWDDNPARHGREEGFRARAAEAGIPSADVRIVHAEPIALGGYAATLAMLGEPEPPTGIFCFNDRTALGALRAAAELGVRVPYDLSIVGFDDQPGLADSVFPALTTIALPHYEMGVWAAEQLFARIDAADGDLPAVQTLKLRGPVIHRDSVSSPPR